MKKFSKVISLVLLVVVISSLFVPALAEGWQTRYGTENLSTSSGTAVHVKNLQIDLNKYFRFRALTEDGVFGKNTKSYVIQFQRKMGITADGIVGSATKSALWNALY